MPLSDFTGNEKTLFNFRLSFNPYFFFLQDAATCQEVVSTKQLVEVSSSVTTSAVDDHGPTSCPKTPSLTISKGLQNFLKTFIIMYLVT